MGLPLIGKVAVASYCGRTISIDMCTDMRIDMRHRNLFWRCHAATEKLSFETVVTEYRYVYSHALVLSFKSALSACQP